MQEKEERENGVAGDDDGDGRARRGGLAWRATATGERAEAAGWRRRAGERRRLGRRPWQTTRSHKEYGVISRPGWSWASIWASILCRPDCKCNFKGLNLKTRLEML